MIILPDVPVNIWVASFMVYAFHGSTILQSGVHSMYVGVRRGHIVLLTDSSLIPTSTRLASSKMRPHTNTIWRAFSEQKKRHDSHAPINCRERKRLLLHLRDIKVCSDAIV